MYVWVVSYSEFRQGGFRVEGAFTSENAAIAEIHRQLAEDFEGRDFSGFIGSAGNEWESTYMWVNEDGSKSWYTIDKVRLLSEDEVTL